MSRSSVASVCAFIGLSITGPAVPAAAAPTAVVFESVTTKLSYDVTASELDVEQDERTGSTPNYSMALPTNADPEHDGLALGAAGSASAAIKGAHAVTLGDGTSDNMPLLRKATASARLAIAAELTGDPATGVPTAAAEVTTSLAFQVTATVPVLIGTSLDTANDDVDGCTVASLQLTGLMTAYRDQQSGGGCDPAAPDEGLVETTLVPGFYSLDLTVRAAVDSEAETPTVTSMAATALSVSFGSPCTNLPPAGTEESVIVGTDDADVLCGGAGADAISGLGGDDEIYGFGGPDELRGGTGRDLVIGGDADDVVEGAAGSDRLDGGAGADQLVGGPARDVIAAGAGANTVHGGGGDDMITGGLGTESLFGGDGNDAIRGSAGNDILDGGAGADDLRAGDGRDKVAGGSGPDALRGEAGSDRLDGGTGMDTAYGGSGPDAINGGAGNWSDVLFGEAGEDRLSGGAGADLLFGGDADDELLGNDAADSLRGGSGRDRLVGGRGADEVAGDGDADLLLLCDRTADQADGGPGADRAFRDRVDDLTGVEIKNGC